MTQERLKELLDYNPNTGEFKWKVKRRGTKLNKIAGNDSYYGYRIITIEGKCYKAHRLAWFYVYGKWPKHDIDHKNGIRNDNRFGNLLDKTSADNSRNRIEHRNGHTLGLTKKGKKWLARVQVNKKRFYLGYFETEQEAHEAYIKKLKELNNENSSIA